MSRPKLKMLKLPLRMADTPWEAMQKRAKAERALKRQQRKAEADSPPKPFVEPIII